MAKTRPRGGKRRQPDITPTAMERLLNSPEAIAAMKPEQRQGLLQALIATKRGLQRSVCSASWFDACWETGAPYPPAADQTPMFACCCSRCAPQGKLWPALYEVTDHRGAATGKVQRQRVISYECFLESLPDAALAQLPSSPSGLALRAIRLGRIKLHRQRTKLGKRRGSPS